MKFASRFAVAAIMALGAASVAQAQTVRYSTAGVFTAGNCSFFSLTSCTVGSGANTATITFNGLTNNQVTAPTNISYGTFTTSATGLGASFVNVNFMLTVTQTLPTSGSQIINSLINGTATPTSQDASAFPNPTSFTLGTGPTASYTIDGRQPLVAPTSNGGVSDITGTVVANITSTVPEPSTYALMGAGLLALGVAARRRKVA